jgi:hypothetical protein
MTAINPEMAALEYILGKARAFKAQSNLGKPTRRRQHRLSETNVDGMIADPAFTCSLAIVIC